MFTIYVQTQGDTTAQAVTTEPTLSQAFWTVEDFKADMDVVMADEMPLGEAMAELDVDGQFQAAWRMRVAGATKYDIVAIVQEP